jgi:hypothetical protein
MRVVRNNEKVAIQGAEFRAADMKAEGTPGTFAPSLGLRWASRGENVFAERRAELRKAADAKINALKQQAIFRIHQVRAATLTGLTSDLARQLLEKIPTLEKLMPFIDLKQIEMTVKPLTSSEHYDLRRSNDWEDD